MVRIRLMRVGKRKQPSYRVVVADSRSPRDGRIIEAIGHYQPRQEPSGVAIDNDRALYWLERGAQPSEQARKLLQITGAWSAFTGEAPPAPAPGAPETPSRPPARVTAAASVEEREPEETQEQPAETPEADQAETDPAPPSSG